MRFESGPIGHRIELWGASEAESLLARRHAGFQVAGLDHWQLALGIDDIGIAWLNGYAAKDELRFRDRGRDLGPALPGIDALVQPFVILQTGPDDVGAIWVYRQGEYGHGVA